MFQDQTWGALLEDQCSWECWASEESESCLPGWTHSEGELQTGPVGGYPAHVDGARVWLCGRARERPPQGEEPSWTLLTWNVWWPCTARLCVVTLNGVSETCCCCFCCGVPAPVWDGVVRADAGEERGSLRHQQPREVDGATAGWKEPGNPGNMGCHKAINTHPSLVYVVLCRSKTTWLGRLHTMLCFVAGRRHVCSRLRD